MDSGSDALRTNAPRQMLPVKCSPKNAPRNKMLPSKCSPKQNAPRKKMLPVKMLSIKMLPRKNLRVDEVDDR